MTHELVLSPFNWLEDMVIKSLYLHVVLVDLLNEFLSNDPKNWIIKI